MRFYERVTVSLPGREPEMALSFLLRLIARAKLFPNLPGFLKVLVQLRRRWAWFDAESSLLVTLRNAGHQILC